MSCTDGPGMVTAMRPLDCPTPCGLIRLHVWNTRLVRAELLDGPAPPGEQGPPPPAAGLRAARRFADALGRAFAGEPAGVALEDLEHGACGPFALRVYTELMAVGFGQLVTYGDLAARAGRPRAARAVGQVLKRNPWPIFVPCHRVVAAGRRLGGFGAGRQWKARLLAHEGWSVAGGRVKETYQ